MEMNRLKWRQMLSFCVLGSGSSGNAILVTSGQTTILVDAGLSGRQLVLRMEKRDFSLEKLDAIVLTHEHLDHTKGLNQLCKKCDIPVYTNALTREVLAKDLLCVKQWRLFASGSPFMIGDIKVEAFLVPHDAVEPVGFVLQEGESRLGIATDLGHVTHLVRERLREVHTLFVESNYDEKMLELDTKRPWSIKQRISSRHGHLSNRQSADLIRDIVHENLNRVVLGHLSSDCNTPETARYCMIDALYECGLGEVPVEYASRDEPSALWPVADPAVYRFLSPEILAQSEPLFA
jgi:phosphoribosyl 1,2-cyclic phosphodiesterase